MLAVAGGVVDRLLRSESDWRVNWVDVSDWTDDARSRGKKAFVCLG